MQSGILEVNGLSESMLYELSYKSSLNISLKKIYDILKKISELLPFC